MAFGNGIGFAFDDELPDRRALLKILRRHPRRGFLRSCAAHVACRADHRRRAAITIAGEKIAMDAADRLPSKADSRASISRPGPPLPTSS